MSARGHLLTGLGLVVVGLVLWLLLGDVETSVIGLRQVGVVLVVIGVLDLGAGVLAGSRKEKGSRPDSLGG